MSPLVTFDETTRVGSYRFKSSRQTAALTMRIAVMAAFAIFNLAALPSAHAAENRVTVQIENFTYSPNVITVAPGTTVTWVNHDDIPHTVTASGKAFRSKALDTDDSFTFTFTTPGDYAYFCALHPHMTGTVVVKPAAG